MRCAGKKKPGSSITATTNYTNFYPGIRRVYYTMDDQTLRMEYVDQMISTKLSVHQEQKINTDFQLWYFG